MRTFVILFVLIGAFACGLANAAPGNDSRPVHVSECDAVKDGTKGLYGLCVSFCAQQGKSDVDLNDEASVRAAASDIRDLQRYDQLRHVGDPEMPCLPDSDTPPPPGDEPPPPGEPPAATSCPCWSGTDGAARLASIDGVTTVDPSFAKCTSLATTDGLVYRMEVKEAEGSAAEPGALVGVAWASTAAEGVSRYNGCFIDTVDGQLGLALGSADAQQCIAEVVNQCAAIGNP